MKKTILKIATVLLFGFQLSTAMAQAPQKMSYQAVIRNAGNALVTSVPVGMQISILQGSATGTAVYVETQTASTNINGLVTIEIGNGTPVSGTFSSIDWSAGPYFIMTETDPTGGTAYSISGTTQLMSVPYALYAETSGSGAVGATGATGADGINGTNGVDGTNGTNGADGINGIDGTNGTNGVDGINGTNGVDGTNGTNGVDGTNGANGIDGINGVDGIAGATGSTGATGAMGPMGPMGMGMPGMNGTNGTNGTNGSTGATGATGAIGATGLAGTNGTNGTNGSAGATGAVGATGLAGTNGTNGTNGTAGTNGTNGSTGATGAIGATGLAGTNGIDGTNGTDGAIGATGATGLIADGAAAGNTPYWNGTAWVVNSSNIYNNGGNVGIGTTTPNAPLQFSNATVTRKIVLWEGGNNDHQFYGLGINSAMLRYQIDGPGACHAFYSGSGTTTSNELMRIQGNGNVGIGTNAPSYKLDVASATNVIANFTTTSTSDRSTLLRIGNNNTTSTYWNNAVGGIGNGLGLVNGEYYIESPLGAKDFVIRNQGSALTETFRIRGSNGGVGIGTATPNAALQFANVLTNRRIVLWEDANNDHQFYGFGMNGNTLRYQVAASSQNHVFYAGASTTTSNELMRIQGNGNVGIGTSAPSAKLEVAGNTKINGQLEIATTTGAILIPRLTATERTAVAAIPGMMIYNSSTGKFQGYAAGIGVEALDQSMTTPNTQLTASNIGQSFIAGVTGELSKIDVTVSTFTAAGSCTIRVYDGTGTGGTLLGSLGGTISAAGIKSFALTGINVIAGNTYTFMIVHSANCAWSMDGTNSYPSGSENSGIPNLSWDLWFKTYVKPVVNSWVDFH